MGFHKAQTIIKRGPGGYVDGEWQDGSDAVMTIQGSVQPVRGQELMALPEGLRSLEVVKMYTDTELITLDENQRPDRLVWRGKTIELGTKESWQSDVINHFKYYATKVQVPNDAP